ncbi:MAG: D-alanine--D-alanine ligase family protein [Candidatus Paceibacterota bacterium]
MRRIKVAILRGGPSGEHDVSMKTGKSVIENLPSKYIPIDIYIDKQGIWHSEGVPVRSEKVLTDVDVVFNAMHGAYGEDGVVQQLLEHFKVPFTGSGALASAIGMNKLLAKEIFKKQGIKSPIYKVVRRGIDIKSFSKDLFKSFPIPAVIKPNNSGSSLGISIAKNISEIKKGIEEAFKYSDIVLIEEFINGKEATCGVVEGLRGVDSYPLLPIEIRKPKEASFFDFNSKYTGVSEEICPGNFSESENKLIQQMAIDAHKAIGLRHYSRSDFIVSPKRGIYILEVNTLPGLTNESLLPKSLKAIGYSFPQFLDHLIMRAISGR